MPSSPRPFLTLTTDFGSGDAEAGMLKGVIWGIAPTAQIADLTHAVSPQNVREAALLLGRSAHYFPAGTVHVAVVDPGVGTDRRAIAARLGDQCFVGPDNGLLTQMLERAEQAGQPVQVVALDRPEYWRPSVSPIFHGRDVFAPVAAHLAAGVSLTDMGTPIDNPIRLNIPTAARTSQGWTGQVLAVDTFGNLSTNLYRPHLAGLRVRRIRIAGVEIEGMVKTFGERPPGSLIALIDSSEELSICVVNGSAAERLGAGIGTEFEVIA
jgi:S-adenosyl-L-methionine hydrolase (adenosine-forming)